METNLKEKTSPFSRKENSLKNGILIHVDRGGLVQ